MIRIGIDPGHGGHDPGAIGPTGLEEKKVTLSVGLHLGKLLQYNSFETIFTRTVDTALVTRNGLSFSTWQKQELQAREKIIDNAKCDIAISIHCNGNQDEMPDYLATFIIARGGKAEVLANLVQKYLVKATDFKDGGVRIGNFHMVRETNMPAILPEMGFITNKKEEQWLKISQNQYDLAKAIAMGICAYYKKPFKEEKQNDFKVNIIDMQGTMHIVPQQDVKSTNGSTWVKMRTAAELSGAVVKYDKQTNTASFDYSKSRQKENTPSQHYKRGNYYCSIYAPNQIRVALGKPDNMIITATFSYGRVPLGALVIEGKKYGDVIVKPGVGPRPCFCIGWDDKCEIVDRVDDVNTVMKYRYAFQCGPKVYPRLEDLSLYTAITPNSVRKRGGIGIMSDGSVIVIASSGSTVAQIAELAKKEGAKEFMLVDGGAALNFKQGNNWIIQGDMVSSCITLRD